MTDEATKTPIGEIDDFPFEVNGITTIKVLELQLIPAICGHFKSSTMPITPLIKFKEESHGLMRTTMSYHQYSHRTTKKKKSTQKNLPGELTKTCELTTTKEKKKRKEDIPKETNDITETSSWRKLGSHQIKITEHKPTTIVSCATENSMTTQNDKTSGTINHVSLVMNNCSTRECETTFLVEEKHVMLCATIFHLDSYLHDKNKIWWMVNAKVEDSMFSKILEIKNNSPKPVNIVLIPNSDYLAQINIQLCDHCLIPCDFQYCNKCDLIYNPPPCMIYIIPEEKEPISSYALELDLDFNTNSNSENNNDKNTSSSSTQYGNENNNNLNSNSNSKTFIVLFDLTKEQEFKWFSDNNKDIMLECAHNTDAGFDLRYPKKNAIKLESYLHICINLKIALKIPVTTMVQLVFKSSLAIFLPLVKIAQLVSVENRKELRITARGIQRFRFMGRIDIPINMAEEEVIDKEEIISTINQFPFHHMTIKNQAQLLKAEATICKLEEIELTNLYISAKSPKTSKFPSTTQLERSLKYQRKSSLNI
ncbi:hypothetical protein G9A89_014380 [Geosiphon pyriformis]|nr:hypothetical protein G9A89_014380 [Geosiphon pyriformis]